MHTGVASPEQGEGNEKNRFGLCCCPVASAVAIAG